MYYSMRPTQKENTADLAQGQGHVIQGQMMKNGLKIDLYFLPNILFFLNMSRYALL